ncbi:MAG: flagellar basal-body rod protein FlgC [Clostridia bacterium]|jgi:flagellar basal-body rod protein FlgC|nr:flgC [Clostridiales bacterium]MDK2985126.1 flagellar basal-body rod protein FlgC [Clostridia bacterium]
MNIFSTLNISASGLAAERLRMDLTAQNIANVNTTKTEDGGPYKRKVAVFKEKLQQEIHKRNEKFQGSNEKFQGNGVEVDKIVTDDSPPIMVYDPNHPHANEEGFVAKPNINLADEMVDLITASRAYEANVAVLNATKQIAMKALSIGRG